MHSPTIGRVYTSLSKGWTVGNSLYYGKTSANFADPFPCRPPTMWWLGQLKGLLQQPGPFTRSMSVQLTSKVTPLTTWWVSNWTGAVSLTPGSVPQTCSYTSQNSMFWERCGFKEARTKTVLSSHCTLNMGCPILSNMSELLNIYYILTGNFFGSLFYIICL